MRHFVCLARAPARLTGGVMVRAPACVLVAHARLTQRFVSPPSSALRRAIALPSVAAPTHPHLALAALAVEQPTIVLEHRDTQVPGVDKSLGIR